MHEIRDIIKNNNIVELLMFFYVSYKKANAMIGKLEVTGGTDAYTWINISMHTIIWISNFCNES